MEKYQLVIYDRLPKRLRESTENRRQEIIRSISTLDTMLENCGFRWYLVGGIGVALQHGKLTRYHHDIDIEIDSSDAAKLQQHFMKSDYKIRKKMFTADIPRNRRLAVYKECDIDECTPMNATRIRLVREPNRVLQKLDLLSFIDVNIKKKCMEGTMIEYHGNIKIMKEEYAGPVINVGQHAIRTRNLEYHRIFKMNSQNPIDVYDMKIIDTILKTRA